MSSPACAKTIDAEAHRGPMNRFDKLFGTRGEAQVRYLDGEFQVVAPGDYVLCAVTGQKINLADLRYWSVELQEAYASAEASLGRYLEAVHGREG